METLKILMMNKKLLIKKLPPPKEVDGILTTLDQGIDTFDAEIIASGAESDYKTGDVIIISKYAGEDVIINNKNYIIVDEENVWALKITR